MSNIDDLKCLECGKPTVLPICFPCFKARLDSYPPIKPVRAIELQILYLIGMEPMECRWWQFWRWHKTRKHNTALLKRAREKICS